VLAFLLSEETFEYLNEPFLNGHISDRCPRRLYQDPGALVQWVRAGSPLARDQQFGGCTPQPTINKVIFQVYRLHFSKINGY
jgi:hypothetical protein